MQVRKSEYTYAFVGIVIGISFGIISSIYMYRDAERCSLLLEENRLLKDMLYYKDTNPMDSP